VSAHPATLSTTTTNMAMATRVGVDIGRLSVPLLRAVRGGWPRPALVDPDGEQPRQPAGRCRTGQAEGRDRDAGGEGGRAHAAHSSHGARVVVETKGMHRVWLAMTSCCGARLDRSQISRLTVDPNQASESAKGGT